MRWNLTAWACLHTLKKRTHRQPDIRIRVPQEVKEDRRDEIMELQQEIAFEKAEDMKDRVLEVMIEGKVADENAFVGRTYKDAPNVDGFDFCQCGCSADVRRFLPCPRNGSTRI